MGPYFAPVYSTHFCVNIPYHFTPLNLRTFFDLTFFGWFISVYVGPSFLCGISFFIYAHSFSMGRHSSVVIATRYGLDGPGIESRLGARFSAFSRPALGLTQPPIQWGYRVSFSGGKSAVAWRCVDHPSPCSAEVKERVELYLYFPLGPSWPAIGQSLFLPHFQ